MRCEWIPSCAVLFISGEMWFNLIGIESIPYCAVLFIGRVVFLLVLCFMCTPSIVFIDMLDWIVLSADDVEGVLGHGRYVFLLMFMPISDHRHARLVCA